VGLREKRKENGEEGRILFPRMEYCRAEKEKTQEGWGKTGPDGNCKSRKESIKRSVKKVSQRNASPKTQSRRVGGEKRFEKSGGGLGKTTKKEGLVDAVTSREGKMGGGGGKKEETGT